MFKFPRERSPWLPGLAAIQDFFVVFDGDDEAEAGFPFCVIAGRRVCEHPAKEKNNIL